MSKKILSSLVAGLLVFCLAAWALQDSTSSDRLKEPQTRTMPRQKVLVVEAKGDPNVSAGPAFSLLFSTFFSMPGVSMVAPRARWLNKMGDPKADWVGLYALPLPDSVTSLPPGVTGVRIENWDYGEVAEILYVGPYDKEVPAIEKLIKYIEDNGYVIAGPHEEEYLSGPNMAKSPADYRTIIRYQIKKK